MIKSSTDIPQFACGADTLNAILHMIKELKGNRINVVELDNGGVEITIGNSVYSVERDF